MDGEWRAARNPTEDEVKQADAETQKVGFGAHTDKTYVEAPTKNPKYAEYPMSEGRQDRLSVGGIRQVDQSGRNRDNSGVL